MIGSPIVFHTAPPHPSSKAFATWTYVFVGGPEASQNGFGLLMPAKSTERSAISSTFGLLEPSNGEHGSVSFPPHPCHPCSAVSWQQMLAVSLDAEQFVYPFGRLNT